jgi:hypothetical protein
MTSHRTRKPVDEFDETPAKYPSQLPPKSDGKNPNVMVSEYPDNRVNSSSSYAVN